MGVTVMYDKGNEIKVPSSKVDFYLENGFTLEPSKPASAPAPKKAETTVKTSGTESK